MYEVTSDEVIVLAFVHGARDLRRLQPPIEPTHGAG
jgi:hypothetical protein